MEYEQSQRALTLISQCRRRFIIRLGLGRNLFCPLSSHSNRLRRIHSTIVIIRIHFRKFRLLSASI